MSDRLARAALVLASAIALAGFGWPLVARALPDDAQAAVPVVALALVPAAVIAIAIALDRQLVSATTVAMLGVLTAVGVAVRLASTGVGGLEAVFIVLILAGRAYGARFGFLLGVLVIALSSLVWGGVGPWTPFQMFACGWVAAGAGLLPRRAVAPGWEIALVGAYGVLASYAFGLVMNFWFWPFAVGPSTAISYDPSAPLGETLASFGLYSLATSTLTWDTVRAITTLVGVLLVGPATLRALRRAPIGLRVPRAARPATTPRSSAPAGDGTRTRPSTAPDAIEVRPREPHPSAPA